MRNKNFDDMGTLTNQLCPDKMTNCQEHSEPLAFAKPKQK